MSPSIYAEHDWGSVSDFLASKSFEEKYLLASLLF